MPGQIERRAPRHRAGRMAAISKPSSADAAMSTSCPRSVRNSRNAQQMLASSSTIRMRLIAALSAVPLALGSVKRKRVRVALSRPGEPPAVLGGHLLAECKAEPHAFGLARDERLEQGFGHFRRRAGPGVADLDGHFAVFEPMPRARPRRRARPPRPRSSSGSGRPPAGPPRRP